MTVAASGTCLAVGGGEFYEFRCRGSPFSGLRTLRNRESAGTLGGMGVEPAIKVAGSGTSGGPGFSASGVPIPPPLNLRQNARQHTFTPQNYSIVRLEPTDILVNLRGATVSTALISGAEEAATHLFEAGGQASGAAPQLQRSPDQKRHHPDRQRTQRMISRKVAK